LALTGQSNISAFRPDLQKILSAAKRKGYYTLLDAAALASTSPISLAATSSSPTGHLEGNVDALAVSFYKMFGYPTGVGALIARKDFLAKLKRPWFAGGTVEVVGIPRAVTESKVECERFEEGTLNYATLVAVPAGLKMLKGLISGPLPILPLRLGILHRWLQDALERITHSNGAPVLKVLTSRQETVEGNASQMGYILSLDFFTLAGDRILPAEVSRCAAEMGISLRSGCMCNPGGATGLLGLRDEMMRLWDTAVDHAEIERFLGENSGVVRLSLGLVTDFRDVWEVERFVKGFAQ
jgi:molybdenum cofactor sulfurtransferase